MFYPAVLQSLTFIAVILLQGGIANAQNSSDVCVDTPLLSPNASTSFTIPRPGPGPNRPASWTVGTAVRQFFNSTLNSTVVRQSYWLKTDPVISDTPENLPFGGCIILMGQGSGQTETSLNNKINSRNGNGSCTAILPKGCTEALIEQYKQNAEYALSQTNANNTRDVCDSVRFSYPSACDGAFGTIHRFDPFGNTNYSASSRETPNCNRTSSRVFNGSPAENAFHVESSDSYTRDSAQASLYYNKFVQRTAAVLFITWPRTASDPEASVQSVCLTAERGIQAGSRDPAKTSAAPSTKLVTAYVVFSLLFSSLPGLAFL